jgi:hypothetical protein
MTAGEGGKESLGLLTNLRGSEMMLTALSLARAT